MRSPSRTALRLVLPGLLAAALVGTAPAPSRGTGDDGAGRAKASPCPACREAIARSRGYWTSIFEDILRERPMDPGLYATLFTVARYRPEFRAFLDQHVSEANLPQGNWARLIRRSFPGLPDLGIYADPRHRLLTRVLYCDRYEDWGASDRDALTSMADGSGGYWDTHVLMGLLFLRENGCGDEAAIVRGVAGIGARVAEAQRADPTFSDLFAERVVILFWAGLGDQVEEGWIRTILEAQNPDHGWGLAPGQPSHPHASSNAILALAYHLDGAPRQDFYYPVLPEPDAAGAAAEPPAPPRP